MMMTINLSYIAVYSVFYIYLTMLDILTKSSYYVKDTVLRLFEVEATLVPFHDKTKGKERLSNWFKVSKADQELSQCSVHYTLQLLLEYKEALNLLYLLSKIP